LWARRKVGYLLDQIRANGEKKELVEETVALAKKYGIATPYTSYLVVPDGPVPVVGLPIRGAGGQGRPDVRFHLQTNGVDGFRGGIGGGGLGGLGRGRGAAPAASPVPEMKVVELAREAQKQPGDLAANRAKLEDSKARALASPNLQGGMSALYLNALKDAGDKKKVYDQAREALARRRSEDVQAGKLGVDLSVDANNLRSQCRVTQTALQCVAGRNCLELSGVWIDEGFDAKMPAVIVKCMSTAYFRILERHPEVKDVFKLGNYLVWVTPNRTALVIDLNDGKEKLADAEIDKLFVAKK
jgi:Ca-activated chloride channel family protein